MTRLNNLVLQALLDAGLPACALSPCGTWTTTGRQPTSDGAAAVAQLLRAGLVPVLHGDAVLDHELGCTILSGDVLVRRLAEALTPACVVFLTNVAGIYDSPPDASPGAGGTGPAPQLIEVIDVQADGSWTVAAPPSLAGLSSHGSSGSSGAGIRFEAAAHDTTGGIAAKVAEAAAIAMLGVDVLIAQAGSQDGARACSQGAALFAGAANGGGSSGWRGTWVRRAAVPCSSPARSPARDVLI